MIRISYVSATFVSTRAKKKCIFFLIVDVNYYLHVKANTIRLAA